jgi:hypothetical protein
MVMEMLTSFDWTDAGYALGSPRRVLCVKMRKAIQIRVASLEAEQEEAATEIEALYERSTILTYEVIARQQVLRQFREILLIPVGAGA